MAVAATGIVTSANSHSSADLNAIFEEKTGSAVADTGVVTSEGTHVSKDMSDLFEPIASGSKTSNGNVGIVTSEGVHSSKDLADLFAGIGTVGPSIIFDTEDYPTTDPIYQNDSSGTAAQAGIKFNSDGSCDGYSETSNDDIDDVPINWLDDITSGNGDDFEIRYSNLTGVLNIGSTITTTYQRMNINRVIYIYSTSGTVTATFDIDIRAYGSSDTPDSRACSLRAVKTGGTTAPSVPIM